MDYGEVLTKAWKIIWKHKILWIFGILASFANGSGGGGGGSNTSFSGEGSNPISNLPPEFTQFINDAQRFVENTQWWVWVLITLGILLLAVIFAAIGTIGKIELITGAKDADASEEKLHFADLLKGSLHSFWRVFWFNFLAGLAVFLVILIIFVPLILLGVITAGVGLLCLIPLFCLIIPFSWAISIVMEQTNIAIVINDATMIQGLKDGWLVCKKNPWQLILMSLILGIGGGIVNFIVAIPMFLALIPIIITLVSGSQVTIASASISLLICCAYMPILYLLTGIVTSYIQSAWTLTFLRLAGGSIEENILPVEILPEVPPIV